MMSLERNKLEEMTRGWFVGNFFPTLFATNDVEVAVISYKAGDVDMLHYHKIATEITVILNGTVRMSGETFGHGDIVTVRPGVATDFTALTDVTTVVVKLPGVNNDKYNLL
jgi:mannose-6-phosphate isomerase-like protein (cupin superfamily)